MSALTINRFSSSNSGRSVSTISIDASSERIRPRGATPPANSNTCRKPSRWINAFGDLTAVRDVGFGAKKGGELGGGTDAGVMSSHNAPKNTFSELDRLSSGRGQHEQRRISLKKCGAA